MIRFRRAPAAIGAALFAGLIHAAPAQAAILTEGATVVFAGSLRGDDDVALHDLEVFARSALAVAFESFSYAGGTMRDGTVVPSGGFDPVIALYASDDRLIDFADDGLRRKDPESGDPYDAFLGLTLAPGHYRLAVTQYNNYPVAGIGGFLSEGFTRAGEGNFTSSRCGASAFCDSGGFARTPDYVVEVATLSAIPVPGGLALLLSAIGTFGAFGIGRRKIR